MPTNSNFPLLPPGTKLGQGNVFTNASDSVHSHPLPRSRPPSREQNPPHPPGADPLGADPPGAEPISRPSGADPPGAEHAGRYGQRASYWNAILYYTCVMHYTCFYYLFL